MNYTIKFSSDLGISLNISNKDLIDLLEEYHACKKSRKKPKRFPQKLHQWIDEPGYDPSRLEGWMDKLKDKSDRKAMAGELRDHLSQYVTFGKYREQLLGDSLEMFMSFTWVQVILYRKLIIEAISEMRGKEGSIGVVLLKSRIRKLLSKPFNLTDMKKISPRTAEMLNKQGPAGKLKQVVPLPAHGNNSVASDFVNQLLSGISPNRSVRDKALAEMFALIMMLNEAGLSERYGMLVAGSAAAWLGFLVTEKKYKSGGDYQKYLVNTLDAARNRYVDRLQRKAS